MIDYSMPDRSMPDIVQCAINRITFLSSLEKIGLYESIHSLTQLRLLHVRDIAHIVGRTIRANWSPSALIEEAKRDLYYLERQGIRTYCYADYAPQLREIFDPPFLVYVRGNLPRCDMPWVAVVGTRHPSAAGTAMATRLGREIARYGVPVVSGLAYGIDSIVHRNVVKKGGQCVAILGCGIDRIYPAAHKSLASDIIRNGGAVMSEYAPGIPPRRYQFPARNRIISGLVRSVIVVEAPERSGVHITVDYALQQGRDVYVCAEGLNGERGAGTRKLAELGSPLIHSFDDVLSDWNDTYVVRTPVDSEGVYAAAALGPQETMVKRLEQELNI